MVMAKLLFVIQDIIQPKVFLFHSAYLTDMKLTLPLAEQQSTSSKKLSIHFHGSKKCKGQKRQSNVVERVVAWFLGEDENSGSEDFLANARKILIQERSFKVQQRKREMKQKTKKEMKEEIRRMSIKVSSLQEIVERQNENIEK